MPYPTDLYNLFLSGIQSPDYAVKVSAIEAVGCYVVKEDPKKVRKFDDLAPHIISNTL